MNLTEFLMARIAEDEAAARGATPGGRWEVVKNGHGGHSVISPDVPAYGLNEPDTLLDDESGAVGPPVPTMQHIARHDPARVLAECEAKRGIVKAHPLTPGARISGAPGEPHSRVTWHGLQCQVCGDEHCPTLRLLAAVYASHPDYRSEWAP